MNQNIENQNDDNDSDVVTSKSKIDFSSTLFSVDQDTIEEIIDRVQMHHAETGGGYSTADMATQLLGDKKFAPAINFTVLKYCTDELEITQGIGIHPKGVECKKGVRVVEAPEEEYMKAAEAFCLKHLEVKPKGVAVKSLTMLALMSDAKHGTAFYTESSEGPDDRKFRAALSILCQAPEGTMPKYEIKGGDFRRVSPANWKVGQDNKIPARPGQKSA
jgi:hypothetical protein